MELLRDYTATRETQLKVKAFVAHAVARALTNNSPTGIEHELELRLGPRHPHADLLRKAATDPVGTTAGEASIFGQAFLAGEVTPRSAFGALPFLQVPPGTRIGVPDVTGIVGGWVDELDETPVGDFSTDLYTLNPGKLAGIVVLTNEVVRDPAAEGYVRRLLGRAAAILTDTGAFDPTDARSLTTGAPSVPATSDPAADVGALLALLSGGAPSNPALVLGSTAARVLAFSPNPALHGVRVQGAGSVAGVQAFVSPAPALADLVIALDLDGIVTTDAGIDIDGGGHATLNMDTAPAPGGARVSMWQRNLTPFRVRRFVGWLRRTDAAAVLSVNVGS